MIAEIFPRFTLSQLLCSSVAKELALNAQLKTCNEVLFEAVERWLCNTTWLLCGHGGGGGGGGGGRLGGLNRARGRHLNSLLYCTFKERKLRSCHCF